MRRKGVMPIFAVAIFFALAALLHLVLQSPREATSVGTHVQQESLSIRARHDSDDRPRLSAGWTSSTTEFLLPKQFTNSTALNLRGMVLDSESLLPIASAELKLKSHRALGLDTETDALGRFRFSDLQPGRYLFSASKAGYLPKSGILDHDLTTSQPPLTIHLTPGQFLSGLVLARDDLPIPDVTVILEQRVPRAHYGVYFLKDQTQTDGEGRFVLKLQNRTGNLRVRLEKTGFQRRTLKIDDLEAALEPLPIYLTVEPAVTGIVRSTDREPLKGATVRIEDGSGFARTAKTGEDGRYLVPLRTKLVRISAAAFGYFRQEHVVDLAGKLPRGDQTVDFLLQGGDAWFEGKITDTSGAPIGGAQVLFVDAHDGFFSRVSAQPDGSFRQRVRSGAVFDMIVDSRWRGAVRRANLSIADSPLLVSLEEPGGIIARVLSAGGETIQEFEFTLGTIGLPYTRGSILSPGGVLSISPLSPGRYTLSVQAEGRLPASHEIEIACGDTKEVAFELEPGIVLQGRVQDSGGAPIEYASLTLRDRGRSIGRALTDDSGYFQMDGLIDGSFELTVTAPGVDEVSKSIQLTGSRTKERVVIVVPRR